MTRRPFNFRLERVRALRERAEEQAREQLASSLAIRLKGEAMLRAASADHHEAQETRRKSSGSHVSGADLMAAQAYIERTQRAREAAALELDRRDAEVDASRSMLTEKARDREVLERLKQRKRVDHDRESERREGVLLDEMATIAAHRRAAEA